MARIKKYAPELKLSSFQTFLVDENPNSEYFRITEFKDTFTGGKNGFLIEGSECLRETTEIKIEILDVAGNTVYYEPGDGIPEYYEGISKPIAVYIYNDTPIGLGKITILGELKEYTDNGVKRPIPSEWKDAYNVKWEKTFQINKKLSNEDKVRFYRRPEVVISEINKPIFNNNSNIITQNGNVAGVPLVPTAGTPLADFSLPTSYRLNVNTGNNWTGSIKGQSISFDDIGYTTIVDDIISETEVIVSPPYTVNGIVEPFSSENYTTSFNYIEGVVDLATALTGSFAKIQITDMKTFIGDAARVKVYRRSQSNLTDFEFVQEIQLESNELLRDIETTDANEITYGTFTEDIISNYWVTSSNDVSVELNTDILYNSAKLNSTEGNYFATADSFPIKSGVEYTLDFNIKKQTANAVDFLKVTLSGSFNGVAKSQTIINIPSSNAILQKQNFSENIIADGFDEAKLYLEVNGSDWYINNVSLKASQETSFSPDEITFIQQVPKTLAKETFDYRFEFYDINNNYIPVLVDETKTFDGGNLNLFNKDITITPNNLYFPFDSASAPSNPLPPTTITFDVETTLVTGSVTYTSGAYDETGELIIASDYVGGQYPGLLNGIDTLTPILTVSNFTGSRDDITVQYIRFEGEVEGVTDEVVITRTQDGKGGVNFEIRPYRGTIIRNNSENTLELQAIRIDGVNEITLKDGLPQSGFSDAKLRVLSSSFDSNEEASSSYHLLSEAIDSGFIQGVTAGTTGSGEINYNATFDRDSIDSELTVFLMDGATGDDILTSLILTDLQDGLTAGIITFDTEQFNFTPRFADDFSPTIGRVTGSFFLRGTNESPISGTLDMIPSKSIDLDTEEPSYFMFYVTNSFNDSINISVTDFENNIIESGIPGKDDVPYYEAVPTKQLTTNFTYIEDITSASISADKTFVSIPDGKPGEEPVVVEITPTVAVLNSDQRGRVFNYDDVDTVIRLTQGDRQLTFSNEIYNTDIEAKPGTWKFVSPGITESGISLEGELTNVTDGVVYLPSWEDMTDLTASVVYPLQIHPFFTGSFYTQSFTQQFKKSIDGAAAINVELNPQNISLSADENGAISDNSLANTTLKVKQGDEYLEFSTSSLVLPGTFSASLSTTNLDVTIFSASNQLVTERGIDDTMHFEGFTNISEDSSSVDYEIIVHPFSITNGIISGSQSFTRTQLITKQKDGTKARSVSLSTTTEVVNYSGDGVKTSPLGSITLTATPFNTTGSAQFYQYFRDGFAYSLISTNPSFELDSGDATSPGETATWGVELRDGSSQSNVVASSEVTITGIKAGADNYQVFLSNDNSSVTVEVDGTTSLDSTGTQITAFKGTNELTHVQNYSSPTLDEIGEPIGTLGEFSASLHYVDSYITQPNFPIGNPANVDPITAWDNSPTNVSATLVYKIDIENGRATYFLSQSLSAVFEGATGPGIVMRGEWVDSIAYIFDEDAKRRDAVLRDISGTTHYWATTKTIPTSSEYTDGDSVFTSTPILPTETPYEGTIDSAGWEYLGEQEFFVAAKIAIFDESFVKNTINVGTPPAGSPNANIAIVGGSDEPYIAIGQQGVQGFQQDGIFMGMSDSGGASGTSTLGLLSLKSEDDNGVYNSLEWNGDTLTIRGALRQTAAGQREGTLQGLWSQTFTPANFQFVENDIVTHADNTWVCISNHTKNTANSEPLNGSSYETYWATAAAAGTSGTAGINAKTLRLSTDAQSFIVAKDGTISPSTITLTSSRQNISDSTVFTSSPNVTLGGSGDTATLSKENFGSNTAVTITATADGFSDEITIVKLAEGTDALTIINSNQAHTLPASPTGVVSSYVGSGTSINLFEGTTPLNHKLSYPQAAGDFTINFSGTDITTASPSTGYSPTFTISDASNMTDSVDIASIDFEICIKRLDGTTVTGSIKQSFSKSKTGTNGEPGSGGAGIVYRGEFKTTDTYTSTSVRTDVVKYNGAYYICNTDGATGAFVNSEWDSFGAEFTSVATDILFADEVYANQTINIGSEGTSPVISLNADHPTNANPRISIGQTTSEFLEEGIYMGYSGSNPVLSMVAGDSFMSYEGGLIEMSNASFVGSGSLIEGSEIKVGRNADSSYNFVVDVDGNVFANNANLSGSINAETGRIGDWIIDSEKRLRDEDSEIIFDPSIPEIQIFSEDVQDAGLEKKIIIGSNSLLGSAAGTTETINWSTTPTFPNYTSGFNSSTNTINHDLFTSVSGETAIPIAAGEFSLTGIDTPSYQVLGTNLTGGPASNVSYPNYQPSYNGQIHGGFPIQMQTGAVNGYLYLQIVDDSGTSPVVIGEKLIKAAQGRASAQVFDTYVAASTGGGFESVIGDTEIILSDNTIKLAKDITKHDLLLSWDESINAFTSSSLKSISNRRVDIVYKVSVGGLSVTVSDTHGFWLDSANEIKVTDIIEGETKIYIRDGNVLRFETVSSVELINDTYDVFTFSVPPLVNYVSNGIISHNPPQFSWVQTDFVNASNATDTTVSATTSVNTNITVTASSTEARLRWKFRTGRRAGSQPNVSSNGTMTYTTTSQRAVFYNAATNGSSTSNINLTSAFSDSIQTTKTNNFVEMQAGGIQVVSGNDTFVRMRRIPATNTTDKELFTVSGGTAYLTADTDNPKASIISDGNILPTGGTSISAGWDLGAKTTDGRWEDIWVKNINGSPAGWEGSNTSNPRATNARAYCIFNGRSSGTGAGLESNHYNVDSVQRVSEGVYKVTLDDSVPSGLPLVSAYGRKGDGNSPNPGDPEFTRNIGAKLTVTNNNVTQIFINTKDNNTDSNMDPEKVYFVLFGNG